MDTTAAKKPPKGYDRYKASSYRAFNGKMWERYDTSLVNRIFNVSHMDDCVLELLGANIGESRILDVGCGTGRLLAKLAEAGASNLAGSDLAPRILDVARRKMSRYGSRRQLECADAEDVLPWNAATFDVVVMTGVLHHFLHPKDALGEAARVLRDGGMIILVDACFFPPVRHIINLCLIHPHQGDCHFYDKKGVRGLFDRSLWENVQSRRLNWCFFSAVASRTARDTSGLKSRK